MSDCSFFSIIHSNRIPLFFICALLTNCASTLSVLQYERQSDGSFPIDFIYTDNNRATTRCEVDGIEHSCTIDTGCNLDLVVLGDLSDSQQISFSMPMPMSGNGPGGFQECWNRTGSASVELAFSRVRANNVRLAAIDVGFMRTKSPGKKMWLLGTPALFRKRLAWSSSNGRILIDPPHQLT